MPGKQKGTTPLGFTPPNDYIIDPNNTSVDDLGLTNPNGIKELGQSVYNELRSRTTQESLESRRLSYDYFRDFGTEQFTHLLDFQDQYNGSKLERRIGEPNNAPNNAYLGSFIRTLDDNEDPTMLGFDIKILVDESPLFNGDIDEFISTLGAWNSEIASRQSILDSFRSQLFKFLKNDNPSRTNSDGSPYHPSEFIPKRTMDSSSNTGVKVYYLKKIAGLDKLTESTDSSEIKSFVDYGKDFISLTFWEDVSQNIGYLSSLYKQLWWSRINGKSIIPQNLLRFDVEITITEIRKYNRVINNNYILNEYVDNISKYTYRLYECQFFFTGLPHGDALDMTAPVTVDTYDMKFNYKNSTMKFTKFYDPGPLSNITSNSDLSPDNIENYYTEIDIDNSSINGEISGINTNNSSIGSGGIQHNNNITPLDQWNVQNSAGIQSYDTGLEDDTIESLRTADKAKAGINDANSLSSLSNSEFILNYLQDDYGKSLRDSINESLTTQEDIKSYIGNANGTFLGQGFGRLSKDGSLTIDKSSGQPSYDTQKPTGDIGAQVLYSTKLTLGSNTGPSKLSQLTKDSFTSKVDLSSEENQGGPYETYNFGDPSSDTIGDIEYISSLSPQQQYGGSPFDKIGRDLLRDAIGVVNTAILSQAALLSKSINQITGGINPPTNVYYEDPQQYTLADEFASFVGESVRGFFTNPNQSQDF
jgi:hypothetical protein